MKITKILSIVVAFALIIGIGYFTFMQQVDKEQAFTLNETESESLKKVISAELYKELGIINQPLDTITITVVKTSSDGLTLNGSVGWPCEVDPAEEDRAGCGATLYASKLSGSWKVVIGNGFSCQNLLDIGISREWALQTFSEVACR